MKTVYEWLKAKDFVVVTFNSRTDNIDYGESLQIKMDAGFSFGKVDGKTHFSIPIIAERIYYGATIPENDEDMMLVLDDMYKQCINEFNNYKYRDDS